MFSIVIPVFNEQGAVEQTVRTLHATMERAKHPFEIIVVNDGSTDDTSKILERISLPNVKIVTHPENRGNGAAILSGIAHAKGDVIATVDADGTYPLEAYPALVALFQEGKADMVVGARTKPGACVPRLHRPAKKILTLLAQSLTGKRILDINSGMRIAKRELWERYRALYPQRFSLHITLTMAALLNGAHIRYEPIDYHKRIGESAMTKGMRGMGNFLRFIIQILRIAGHFQPRTKLAIQIGTYLMSGATAAALNYGSYLLLLAASVHYLTASTVSEGVGFISAFLLQKYVVFGKRSNTLQHFGRYCLLALVNMMLVTLVLYLGVEYMGISEKIAKLIAMALVVCWNFLGYKFFVYI